MAVPRDEKRHLLAIEFDLEVFLLGLLRDPPEPFEHLDDVTPCDVVRCWMSEDLLQCLLRVWHVRQDIAHHCAMSTSPVRAALPTHAAVTIALPDSIPMKLTSIESLDGALNNAGVPYLVAGGHRRTPRHPRSAR